MLSYQFLQVEHAFAVIKSQFSSCRQGLETITAVCSMEQQSLCEYKQDCTVMSSGSQDSGIEEDSNGRGVPHSGVPDSILENQS